MARPSPKTSARKMVSGERVKRGGVQAPAPGGAERTLRESEERFRATFEQVAVGVAHTTTEGRFLQVNNKLCQLVGYTADELLALTTRDLTHPDDRDRQDALRQELLSGQRLSFAAEKRYVQKDGSELWVNRTVTLARRASTGARYLIQVVEDISERKRSESEQKRALSLLQATLDSTADGILVVDREGRVTSCNRRFLDLWRIPSTLAETRDDEQLLGYVLAQLAEPERFVAKVKELYAHPAASSEDIVVFKDGRIYERHSLPQILDGEIIGRVWSFRDATVRRRAVASVLRLSRAQRVMAECTHVLVHATNETEMLNNMCRVVVESGGYKMAWVGLVTGDPARPVHAAAHAGFEGDVPMSASIAWSADGRYQGFMHEVITTGKPHIARNILNDPTLTRRRARAVRHDFQSSIALPLGIEGSVLGAVALYASEADAFDTDEIALLTGLADDIAFGVVSLRERSARQNAEAAQRESEERFRSTFEQAAVGISHVNLDGVLINVNQTFCDMLRYSRDALIGKTVKEITHPDDYGQGSQYREKLARGALGSTSGEKRFVRRDGTILWGRRTISTACDKAGKPQYVISIVEDITERKAAEERYRATFDSAPVGIMHTSIEGYRILRANSKLCEMLGYTQDELLRMTSTDVVHPDYRFTDARSYQDQMRSGGIQTFASERVFVRKDGSAIWVNRTISLVRDAAGKPDYYIRIIEDITERKQAEQVRANLAAIVESANVAIFGRTLDGAITTWNAGAERLFGYTATEAIGQPATFNLPPGRQPALAHNTEVILRGEATTPVESRRLTKDGRVIDVLTSHSPIRDGAGNIVGASVILHDITEHKRAEEARANLAAIVENANDAIVSRSPDDTIRSWNKAAERMFGWSAQEAIGRPITIITAPEYRAKVRPFVERAMRGETVAPIESFNHHRNGSLIETSVTFSPATDATGKVVLLSIVFRDITQQKRAVEGWHRLASIVDSSNDAIIGRSSDGKIDSWNLAAERLFGWNAAEAIGQKSSMLVPPDYEEQAARNRALLEKGSAVIDRDTVRLTKDGRRIPVSLTLSRINDASGALIGASLVFRDISERKRAEEALRASEERFRATIDSAPIGIMHTGIADDRILQANPKLEEMLGYTRDELLAMSTDDIIAPDQVGTDRLKYREKMLSGELESFSSERKYRRKDGSSLWVNRTVSLARDASGKPLYFIRIVEDVTNRKQTEELIAQERALLRTILDAIPDVIYVKDRAGTFLLANKAWLAIRGKPGEDVAGKTVLHYFPQEIAKELAAQDLGIVKTGIPLLDVEQRLIIKGRDGGQSEERWAATTKVPLRTVTGEIIGTAGISRDITEQKRSEARRAMSHTVTRVLAESATLAAAMPQILRAMCEAMGWAYGARWAWNEEEQRLCRVEYWCKFEPEFEPADREFWLKAANTGSGRLFRRAWIDKKATWLTNLHDDKPFRRRASAAKFGWQSAYAFPIQIGNEVIGIMEFFGPDRRVPDEALLQVTGSIGSQIAQFIQRKQAENKIAFLAQFDTITDLPNRFLFNDRLGQMLTQSKRNSWTVGILFVDLDRFKMVNDTYGHAAGDKLLRLVAERIKECVRSGDTVGRLSGDEFAVILANLAKADDAGLVAQKIVETMAASFDLDGHQIYISASIGIALHPSDGDAPDALLKNADTAMYRAKEQGRNGYQFYLPEMNERLIRRQQLDAQLHGALDRQEFLLHYQPKVSLATGAITGFEALLRWRCGELLVPPADFIFILEETGLIVPVGEWVLKSVCEQIKRWEQDGITARPVAVNLSVRQFQRKNLAEVVGRALRESGIKPDLIKLELTESLLMSDAKEAVETLHQLKNLGLQLSVDDFGTGYSSLAYLKRFPLDELKIDRAFIRDTVSDPDDSSIVIAIINLAHSLKLKVVAEGVETEGQLNFLRLHGCDEMQGYFFARPLPVEECTRMLAEDRRLPNSRSVSVVDSVTLLLVDDNEAELSQLKQAFAPGGFRILTANSASDGFEILAQHDVDIVVSDNQMPRMGGIEFLSRIRKLHSNAVRVLASSGDDAPTLTRATNRAGIHLFLHKDWAPERLRVEVREIMQARAEAAAVSGQYSALETKQE